jgi:hypothetical protein
MPATSAPKSPLRLLGVILLGSSPIVGLGAPIGLMSHEEPGCSFSISPWMVRGG